MSALIRYPAAILAIVALGAPATFLAVIGMIFLLAQIVSWVIYGVWHDFSQFIYHAGDILKGATITRQENFFADVFNSDGFGFLNKVKGIKNFLIWLFSFHPLFVGFVLSLICGLIVKMLRADSLIE